MTKQKQNVNSLSTKRKSPVTRLKEAFFVIYCIFMLVVICAASIGASAANNVANIMADESAENQTTLQTTLGSIATASAFCFAIFVLTAVFLYKAIFMFKEDDKKCAYKSIRDVFILFFLLLFISFIPLVCQICGNILFFGYVNSLSGDVDPIIMSTREAIVSGSWFAILSFIIVICLFVLIILVRKFSMIEMKSETIKHK